MDRGRAYCVNLEEHHMARGLTARPVGGSMPFAYGFDCKRCV